jgi:hypothetical protein
MLTHIKHGLNPLILNLANVVSISQSNCPTNSKGICLALSNTDITIELKHISAKQFAQTYLAGDKDIKAVTLSDKALFIRESAITAIKCHEHSYSALVSCVSLKGDHHHAIFGYSPVAVSNQISTNKLAKNNIYHMSEKQA